MEEYIITYINKSLNQSSKCRVQSSNMEQLNTVVIPATAGIHCVLLNFETGWNAMDPGLRRGDGFMSYCDKLLFIFVVALDEIFGYNLFVITDGHNGV